MIFDESFAPDLEALQASLSPTAELLNALSLYGYHPDQDEPDPRPLPAPEAA